MRRRAGPVSPVRSDQGQRSGRCGDTPLAKLLPRSGRRPRGSGDGKATFNCYRFQMPTRRDTNAGRAKQVASGHRVSRSAHKVSQREEINGAPRSGFLLPSREALKIFLSVELCVHSVKLCVRWLLACLPSAPRNWLVHYWRYLRLLVDLRKTPDLRIESEGPCAKSR